MNSGSRVVVVHQDYEADARALQGDASVYAIAAEVPGARELHGRGVAYAITLPHSNVPVVVRHNRHGGFLAPLTGDLFLEHTRAPYELEASIRLTKAGVATPLMVMYSEERVLGLFKRSDVVTVEINESRDLSTFMHHKEHPKRRQAAWEATMRLVWMLSEAGAQHHDLNVKNILLSPGEDTFWKAWVLDVDRVQFFKRRSPDVLNNNVKRLFRSARKWRDKWGAVFEEREMMSIMRRSMP